MTDLAAIPVLILAGGKATRLGEIAKAIPKALVPVANRPFIDHQLEGLREQGIRKVVMCVGHFGDQLRDHIGDGTRFGLRVSYSHDGPTPLGTGGAVRQALSFIGEGGFILYGDSLLDVSYKDVLTALLSNALGVMTVFRNDNSFDASNADFRDGRLIRYDKRTHTPEMTHIDYGLSLLRRTAVERIPIDRPTDLAELYTALVASGEMIGHEVTRRFYEIGSVQGLRDTEKFIRDRAA